MPPLWSQTNDITDQQPTWNCRVVRAFQWRYNNCLNEEANSYKMHRPSRNETNRTYSQDTYNRSWKENWGCTWRRRSAFRREYQIELCTKTKDCVLALIQGILSCKPGPIIADPKMNWIGLARNNTDQQIVHGTNYWTKTGPKWDRMRSKTRIMFVAASV